MKLIFLPKPDQRMYERVIEKTTKNPSETSVLELGCSYGWFVNFLQRQGYKVEGVDGSLECISRDGVPGLYHGELTALENVFGDKTFDIIIAQGVFAESAQMEYRYGRIAELIVAFSTPEERKEINNSVQETINQILENAYKHLVPGGFLVVREDISPLDSVDFSKETAIRIGYEIERFERQEAILKKPL